jgi:putative ABC transport system ATP-binding protein
MILEVQELSKEFTQKNEKINAVKKASLQIKSGEFVSIIGPSGSGKSTLFHMITGMQKPTSGKVMIGDLYVNEAGEKQFAEIRNKEIGYVLQEQNLLGNFTVLENVCMPYFISRNRKQINIYDNAKRVLEEVGLWHLKNSNPNEISGGEARRVAIARALINEISIIVADEPTSNLDTDNSTIIMKLFRKISDSGVAVLISTHDHGFLDYSDRAYVMQHGCLEELR